MPTGLTRTSADSQSDFSAGLGGVLIESTGGLTVILKDAKFKVGAGFVPAPNGLKTCPTGGAGIGIPQGISAARKKNAGEKRDPEASASDKAVATLQSMVATLSKCHTAVAVMTQLGFVLALMGIVAYFWTGLPRALGIWATALLGACLVGMGVAVM